MSYSDLNLVTREIAERVLTRKQLDVFKLWMNGYGTAKIALILGVSEPVARAHKNRSLQKLQPYVDKEDVA